MVAARLGLAMVMAITAACGSRASAPPPPVTPADAFSHHVTMSPGCEVTLTAGDPAARVEWEPCASGPATCRRLRYAKGAGPRPPAPILGGLGGPIAAPSSGGVVVALSFGARHVLVRDDGAVLLTLEESADCGLSWVGVAGDRFVVWGRGAGTAITELSGPLLVRSPDQLAQQTLPPITEMKTPPPFLAPPVAGARDPMNLVMEYGMCPDLGSCTSWVREVVVTP